MSSHTHCGKRQRHHHRQAHHAPPGAWSPQSRRPIRAPRLGAHRGGAISEAGGVIRFQVYDDAYNTSVAAVRNALTDTSLSRHGPRERQCRPAR